MGTMATPDWLELLEAMKEAMIKEQKGDPRKSQWIEKLSYHVENYISRLKVDPAKEPLSMDAAATALAHMIQQASQK